MGLCSTLPKGILGVNLSMIWSKAMPKRRLIKKLMAINPNLLGSSKLYRSPAPTMTGPVTIPWTTKPIKIEKPAINRPTEIGFSPISCR